MKTIYAIEEVNGGGLKKYIDDLRVYYDIKKITNKEELLQITDEDVLLVQNLLFTDIEITDLLNIKNIIITIHDWYWMHEYTMKKFFDDHFPPIHTNYLRKNIKIDENIIKLFNHAKKIVHSTPFTYNHYKKYFKEDNFVIIPHIDYKLNFNNHVIPKIINNEINIGILHSLNQPKGEELVHYLMENVVNYKNYKINYLITKKQLFYDEQKDFYELIQENNIHGTTLLNIWGETYCYALTKIINTGIPIIYNNIGSLKYRINVKNEHYFIFSQDENGVYNFDNLKLEFEKMLDYIILNNGINIYENTKEIINHYSDIL
jgi:hypothetical protein